MPILQIWRKIINSICKRKVIPATFIQAALACSVLVVSIFGNVPEHMKGCEQKWKTLEDKYKSTEDGLVLLGRAAFGSFWGRFDCENGQAVHSYCRIGSKKSDNPKPPKEAFLPLSRYLMFDKDKDKNYIYACFDSTDEQVAKIYTDEDRTPTLFPSGKIFQCADSPLKEDIVYCDSPLDVLECQGEYNKILNGRSASNGWVKFHASVGLKFDCDKSKKTLKLSQCTIGTSSKDPVVTVPGKFCRAKDTYYTCPKADTALANLAGSIHAVAVDKHTNGDALKDFNSCVPDKLKACATPWNVITEDGKRLTNEDGSVRIAEAKEQKSYPYKRDPEVWARFVCADQKLVLSECRATDDWGKMKVCDKTVCTKHKNWKTNEMIV